MSRLMAGGWLIGLMSASMISGAAQPCDDLEGRYQLVNAKAASAMEITLRPGGRFVLEEVFGEQRYIVPGRWTREGQTVNLKADPPPPPKFTSISGSADWLKARGQPGDPNVILQVQVVTAAQGLEWKRVTVEATTDDGRRLSATTSTRGVAELINEAAARRPIVAVTVSDPARQVPAQRFAVAAGTRSLIVEFESRALQPARMGTLAFTVVCSDRKAPKLKPVSSDKPDVYFERTL